MTAQKLFIRIIELYQALISPLLEPRCRFFPTCSNYAKESFMNHAIYRAFLLTFLRIIRCNPFCSYGYDPVPKNIPDSLYILDYRNRICKVESRFQRSLNICNYNYHISKNFFRFVLSLYFVCSYVLLAF